MRKLHVAVLMGGWSAEREVSLVTGNCVADALEGRGHRVTRIDMDRDVARRLGEVSPDVVFNALHGTPGEDGTVQGLMDLMGLRYTHSGLETSVIAIDKELTKMVLVPHGIRMPAGRMVASESLFREDPMARPYVLKPVNEGSSVGVAIVTAGGNYGEPIAPGAEAVIEVFAFWGGIDIKVPEDWTVITRAMPLMGGVEDKTRSPLQAGKKRLVIRGIVVMGGVAVKNAAVRQDEDR